MNRQLRSVVSRPQNRGPFGKLRADSGAPCRAAWVAVCALLVMSTGICASAQLAPPPSALDAAEALSQRGDYAGAERMLNEYLSKDPQSERAHAVLGLVKYREGKPDKSLDQYSLAAKYGSLKADDLRVVGLDYVQLHDLPSAERWLKASIGLNAKDWRTWRYLGGVQYSEEHPVEAAHSFEQCLRLDSGNALAEDGLARSHEALGLADKAAEEYREAVLFNSRSTPPSWLPLLHYGSYLRRTSHLSDAIALLQQAEQLAPEDWEAHAELAQADEDNGDLKAAESEFQRAITLAPDRVRLRMMLARTYQRDGQKDKAAAEIKLYREYAAKYANQRDLLDK
jgi:tetratricopeptide (TPR) repeat protein